jgi:hypothetical protein
MIFLDYRFWLIGFDDISIGRLLNLLWYTVSDLLKREENKCFNWMLLDYCKSQWC